MTGTCDRSVHRAVRLTARTSATLFAASLAAPRLGRRWERAARPLYAAFLAAHAAHFLAVARYAVLTGGRDLFPGGRSLRQVGGWPAFTAIWVLFAGLATAARPSGDGAPGSGNRRLSVTGAAARTAIGAMFVGTYIGDARRRVTRGGRQLSWVVNRR